MHKRIFLIGFMGSGKSTLGSGLARKIGYDFVDMDRMIEETSGMTVPGIFSEYGEEVFRKWEHDILIELCQYEDVVVSTGGGAPCHGEMISLMNNHGATTYIKLSPCRGNQALKSQTIMFPKISNLISVSIHLPLFKPNLQCFTKMAAWLSTTRLQKRSLNCNHRMKKENGWMNLIKIQSSSSWITRAM